MDGQTLAVIAIVAVAVLFFVRRIRRALKKEGTCDCCSGGKSCHTANPRNLR